MDENPLQLLLRFLAKLERAGIDFRLDRVRDEAIMVRIDVPGERWEVEFFADGELEIERFGTTIDHNQGIVDGPEAQQLLRELFVKFSD